MMEKRQPLPQMLLGKVVTCLQKTKTRSIPNTLHYYHSKWIKNLIRPKTLNLVQERAGNPLEADIVKDFLSRIQVAQQLKEIPFNLMSF
jgi:hypothetical protein